VEKEAGTTGVNHRLTGEEVPQKRNAQGSATIQPVMALHIRGIVGSAVGIILALGALCHAQQAAPAQEPQSAPAPLVVRAYNEKGQLTGRGWAVPVQGGYVTVRSLLSNAARAEIVLSAEMTAEIDAVGSEDVEGNLVVVSAGTPPPAWFRISSSSSLVGEDSGTDAAPPALRCGEDRFVLKGRQSRDIPVFGLVVLGKTGHREPLGGCPILDAEGAVEAVVVWENPFGQPSAALLPAARLEQLSMDPSQPWAAWRANSQQPAVRLRDSLLGEALQDLWRGDYALAVENLTFLLEKNPEHARAWYYRGYARAMSGSRDLAMGDYENAVHFEPTNADMRFSLGFTYVLLRRSLEAKEQVKELEALDPALAERLGFLLDAIVESEHGEDADDAMPDAPPGEPTASPSTAPTVPQPVPPPQ
jgi:hypothetical protein